MSMIGFPLLLIPLAVVNIVVFLMNLSLERLQDKVITVDLPSLKSWTITFSDVLLAFALFLLLLEVVKSARPGAKYVTDHLLSFVVFAAAAAEFLLLPQFAHATFFLLTLMALTDVVAGIWIRAVRPRPVAARAAPPPAEAERPVSRTAIAEPAPAPVPPKPPADVVEPLAEPRMAEAEPRMAEPHMAERHMAEPHTAEPHVAEHHAAEPRMVEPSPTHEMPGTREQRDVPIAPHQEILPPEPTDTPRR
jgi:hypothetical protein